MAFQHHYVNLFLHMLKYFMAPKVMPRRRFIKVKSRSSASARLPAAMKPGALGRSNLDGDVGGSG